MSLPTHPLLALVDASKNELKVSLTNYIDLQVEKTFGQLRNTIVHMIEHGEIVRADVNALVLPRPNEHLSTDQITSPPTPSALPITAEPFMIKQEYFEINEAFNAQAPIDVFDDVKEEYDEDDYEDEGEYMSDCDDECEDCVKGICQLNQRHLVGENDIANNDADTGVDSEIGMNQDEIEDQPNAFVANDLIILSDDDKVIDDHQSSDDENGSSSINEQQARSVRKSVPLTSQEPSTSGQSRSSETNQIQAKEFVRDQSNQAKSDKRKSKTESSKAAKRINPGIGDEIQQEDEDGEGEEIRHQIVILELTCTKPQCTTILNSLEMWKQHLWTRHGQIPYKQLHDNVRLNNRGETVYRCPECVFVSKNQMLIYDHWRNYHQVGKFKCSGCAFEANLRRTVNEHQQKEHKKRN